ncbi:DUF1289 domain-containing protein [Leptothrix discophora]|uniref:DUF1289 domain-containing protein n=1 Tax=Leptothrix discophora TaxID=89 RepID=A0ABT9G3W9_LEPDI|nr:DUF1289 domain-containing protein [Leptothrix discophora]MDP4301184.1 DUF1289 domain-containing protein [Leptothrix discophora]
MSAAASSTGPAGVPSPCVNVCRLDASQRHCTGCLRRLDEIAGWSRMNDEQKLAVHAAIAWRREHGMTALPPAAASGA